MLGNEVGRHLNGVNARVRLRCNWLLACTTCRAYVIPNLLDIAVGERFERLLRSCGDADSDSGLPTQENGHGSSQ